MANGASKEDHNGPTKARARGRPRRLELDQIIDAALHIGLKKLTMASVAEHLGVGKAVLYGYVSNREELVRIAASRAASRYAFPQDERDHWAIWTLRYCQALFDVLSQDGDMLEFWLNGQQSMAIEIDATEMWVQILSRAGMDPMTALHVRRGASQLVIGAAGAAKRGRALQDLGRSRSQMMPKIIAGRSKEVAPFVHMLKDEIARDDQQLGWEMQLFWMICGAIGLANSQLSQAHNPSVAAAGYDDLFRTLPAKLSQ